MTLVLGMGEWEDVDWADIENDKPQDEALKKFRSVLSTSLSDSLFGCWPMTHSINNLGQN
jgi:hypothetical protein